ncbi:phage major capsid protein [Actinosynnema sp. NPDC023587]|uniref:phage major capsid protein n=1 Tax=Actinosynnema sp. NPDC023587 TaxID=3154695 RepID=UPI0033F817F3
MRTTLSPGRRALLAARGIDPSRVGRVTNRANLAPPPGVPVPRNAEELAEMVADPTRIKDVLADRAAFGGWVQAYADQQQGEGTELRRMVAEESQRQLANLLRENDVSPEGEEQIKRLNLSPQSPTAARRMLTSYRQATAHNPKAPGALLDNRFPSANEFIYNIWHLNQTPEAMATRAEISNAFGSVVPSDGGFLVPETLRSQLLEIALEESVVRPLATVVPMESARVPFPMIDSTTNAGSVFGGMLAYWGEEGAALTESSAKFGRIVLDARKLTGLSAVPSELLQDSLISFTALIERLWPQALAWYEDVAFMTGSGVGEPLGFLGAGNNASVAVAAETSQEADTIYAENIIKMYSRMLPASLNRAVWIVSPEAIPQLYTMALSVGTGGAPVMLVNAAGPGPATMLGRPIIVSEKAGRLGDRGDVAFVDLAYYLVGDRQLMTAASSTDYQFGSDKTTFRIIQRVDGRPWLQSAITPQNGGPALSPFVELAAR